MSPGARESEHRGLLLEGDVVGGCAPLEPLSGKPERFCSKRCVTRKQLVRREVPAALTRRERASESERVEGPALSPASSLALPNGHRGCPWADASPGPRAPASTRAHRRSLPRFVVMPRAGAHNAAAPRDHRSHDRSGSAGRPSAVQRDRRSSLRLLVRSSSFRIVFLLVVDAVSKSVSRVFAW